ncbi:erythrocyte binding antigen-175 [Plasmodium sp. gorilla clade G2]|uniref:erythrocyte binding antigen-175 n=1 Tax=Plasmodium sp. gorilla clade G2 TaxID=880535 RepID=UPI000D202565|nr:erythrocyte binding antigen-175 [Plasmodium sp. gorilla clade G2]SOV13261.1 erythrocyte binding antigen-175 [Plasmodium sp. gorilla clade G2]
MKSNTGIYFFASSFLLYFAKATNEYDIIENEKTLDVDKEKFNELDKNKYENVHTTNKKIFSFIENKLDILNNSKFNKRSKTYVTPDNIDKKISFINKHNNQGTFNNNYQSFLSTSSLLKENIYVPVRATRVSRVLSFLDSRLNNKKNSQINNGDLSNCREKRRAIKWDCKKKEKSNNYICVPDRRIQLCIVNLSIVKTYTKDTMKNHFIDAAKRESQLLFEKNYKKYDSKFCNDLKNSFLDYGHLAMGNDMDFGGYSTKAENKIQEVFKEAHKGAKQDAIKNFRKTWWKGFRNELWNAMIYEHKNKLNSCKNIPADELQINQWIKEWNEEFVVERNIRLETPKSKCNNNTLYEACEKKCIDPCMSYGKWIIRIKYEWDILSKEYKAQNGSKKNPDDYLLSFSNKSNSENVSTLLKKCDDEYSKYCDCKHTTTLVKSVLNGKEDTSEEDREIVDVNDFSKFGCNKKSVETNSKIWECIKPDILRVTGVCSPPRRQEICLGNIDRIFDKNLSMIKEHILAIAIYESRLLKQKYKSEGNDQVCNVIKKSFSDLRDIIKGTDYWNDLSNRKLVGKINTNSNYVHRNMSNDKYFRDAWWEDIKKDVWNVMTWVFKDKNVCKENDIENIPQFFRWFSEWGDEYCQVKIKMIETLNVACKEKGCEDSNCKNKCSAYNEWISKQKELYSKQATKYQEYQKGKSYRTYTESKSMKAEDYLKKYSKKCSNINFETEFNEIFPSDYKTKCTICSKGNDVIIDTVSTAIEPPQTVVPEIKSSTKHESMDNSPAAVEGDTPVSDTLHKQGNLESSDTEKANVTSETEAKGETQIDHETLKEELTDAEGSVHEESTGVLSENLKVSPSEGGTEATVLTDQLKNVEKPLVESSSIKPEEESASIQSEGESTKIQSAEEPVREDSNLKLNTKSIEDKEIEALSTSTSSSNSSDQTHSSDNDHKIEAPKVSDNMSNESTESTPSKEKTLATEDVNSPVIESSERNDHDARVEDKLDENAISTITSGNERDKNSTFEDQKPKENVDVSTTNTVITGSVNDNEKIAEHEVKESTIDPNNVSDDVSEQEEELKDVTNYRSEDDVVDNETEISTNDITSNSEDGSGIESEHSTVNMQTSIVDDNNDIRQYSEEEHHNSNTDVELNDPLQKSSMSSVGGISDEESAEEIVRSDQNVTNKSEHLDDNNEEHTERFSDSNFEVSDSGNKEKIDMEHKGIVSPDDSKRESEVEESGTFTGTPESEHDDVVEKDTFDMLEDSSKNKQEDDTTSDRNLEITDREKSHEQLRENEVKMELEKQRQSKEQEILKGLKGNQHRTNVDNIKPVDKNHPKLPLEVMNKTEEERKQLSKENISIGQEKKLQKHKFDTSYNLQGHVSPEKNPHNTGFHRRTDLVNHSNSVLSAGTNVTNLNNTRHKYDLKDEKLNIELYQKRNDKVTREEIKELAEKNKCKNKISEEYCSHMIEDEIKSNICSIEKTKNMCCAVSDYCMRYFTYGSKEYSDCTKKEFEDPSYICFRKEAFSRMPYYAGAGVLFIILLIFGSIHAKDQSSDVVVNEDNGNNFAFEVTDNLDKLSNMFNQQVQETNVNDFSEYTEDINAY